MTTLLFLTIVFLLVAVALLGLLYSNSALRTKLKALEPLLESKAAEAEQLDRQLAEERSQRVAAETELKMARASLAEISSLRERVGEESGLRIAAETKLQEALANLEEQRKLLEESKTKLSETFQALSADALKSNNQAFLQLAKSAFETIEARAKGELETREKAIDGLVGPLKEALERYESQILEMEKLRQRNYGDLDNELRNLNSLGKELQKQTGSLVTALTTPRVKGRWGELTLRRVAELAGMSEHCDFTEQETLVTDRGRQRPDMIVNLPGARRIAVDAKVPLRAFMDAVSAVTEEERGNCLAQHARLVREHMIQLAGRNYWEPLEPAPEMVVLFLPGESFFAAALEHDGTLIEDGMEKGVIVATPTTLIALLRAIAYGWRQERIAENAREISDLGKELYDRIDTFVCHFKGIGSSLGKAVEHYNQATGSLEARVLTSARKFKELGAATGAEIAEVESLEITPRLFTAASGNGAQSF